MNKKTKSKEILIDYLLSKPDIYIARDTIIKETGISKSRLSELINEIRSDGYELVTPNRSGVVKLESSQKINHNITSQEVRQWLIILALSKLGKASYVELVCSILSIVDSIYLYDEISIDDNYSDMKILDYLKKYNPIAKHDIDHYLPLPTFRKDLHSLVKDGYIDKKRLSYKDGIHVVYSISEKSPTTLFESEDELYDFMTFYDNFKASFSNTEPLESLYRKCSLIYDWECYDTNTQIYGKSNHIDYKQLQYLHRFVQHPYKTKTLEVNYSSRDSEICLTIASGLLFYSIETNSFYLLCTSMDNNSIIQLRLDRINSIREGKEKNKSYRSASFMRIYEEMFSASFEPEKLHVKVLFQDFGNIKERLTTLNNKRKFSKLYEIEPLSEDIPHCIVYEDDLRGLSAFSRFLRSFGSSALVLEPYKLQDMMIESCQRILKNYEEVIDESK